jgi:kumamolisin
MSQVDAERRKLIATVALLALAASAAQAQDNPGSSRINPPDLSVRSPANPRAIGQGQVVIPYSSTESPGDAGQRAHTNYRILVPTPQERLNPQARPQTIAPATVGPPYSGYFYETPASLACIYQLVTQAAGCNPNTFSTVANGGTKVIAIVDAFYYSSALADLQAYSAQFGLPAANLTVVYASGAQPSGCINNTQTPDQCGWAVEQALDVQMAHAMAPNASIYLVEAASDSLTDLYSAVGAAVSLVQAAGGGEISMSWGTSEYSLETSDDATFSGKNGVVFFASSGDSAGVIYPSTSPNVVAVGGTSTSRAWAIPANRGNFREETAWQDGGGGYSAYFLIPSYQSALASRLGNIGYRAVPDVAADANPNTGVWVNCGSGCDSASAPWYLVGGTSVASPLMAGLVNNAGAFRSNTLAQLGYMYSKIGTGAYFDVSLGTCGPYDGFFVTSSSSNGGNIYWSYDLCTGLGAPRGLSGL